MYKKDFDVKNFVELRKCGYITCIHYVNGHCGNNTCELDEKLLRQED